MVVPTRGPDTCSPSAMTVIPFRYNFQVTNSVFPDETKHPQDCMAASTCCLTRLKLGVTAASPQQQSVVHTLPSHVAIQSCVV